MKVFPVSTHVWFEVDGPAGFTLVSVGSDASEHRHVYDNDHVMQLGNAFKAACDAVVLAHAEQGEVAAAQVEGQGQTKH